MTDPTPEPVTPKPKLNVVRIDRNRDVEANDVHAKFAELTEKSATNCERMAGFVVVVWDDEGIMSFEPYMGHMSPIPPVLVPGIIKDFLPAVMLSEPS